MKTREERMYEHLYSNEGRVEQCERICKLEEFVRDLLICIRHDECEESCPYYEEPVEYGPYIGSNGAMYYECSTCCTVGLENCNSAFGNLSRAKELGIEVPS